MLFENCNAATLQQRDAERLKKVWLLFENRNAIVISLQRQNEVGSALPNWAAKIAQLESFSSPTWQKRTGSESVIENYLQTKP